MDPKELASIYPKFAPYFRDMDEFTQVIEDIYLFWRRLQRYSVVYNEESRGGYQNVQFADAQANFEALVLSVYRSIKINVLDKVKMFYVKSLQVSMQGYVFQICVHFYHMNIVV